MQTINRFFQNPSQVISKAQTSNLALNLKHPCGIIFAITFFH